MPDRRVFFFTAARSEYDLVFPVIQAASATEGLAAEVVVAAAHLSPFHGMGVEQIRADGFPIAGCVHSLLSSESWEGRSLSFAHLVEGLTRLLAANRPDVLFIVGDREEVLAAAIVGNFLGIHVAHAFGGDRAIASDIDEVTRAATSKLSHFHFPATESHRQRLIRLGERPEHAWTCGATGLDRLRAEPDVPDEVLEREFGIDVRRPFFFLIQHPSSMINPEESGQEMREILEGLLSLGHPVLCSHPNYDPGNIAIRHVIDEVRERDPLLHVHHNLPRDRFVALYRRCAAMVGNSSSGVIESAFLKVPGILVGPRQDLREMGPNVLRIGITAADVREACQRALRDETFREQVRHCPSLYGDGHAAPRIAEILARVPLTRDVLMKTMTY